MEPASHPCRQKRIAVFAYPGCLSLDVLGPLEIFATADALRLYRSPESAPLFHTEIIAPEAGKLRTSTGFTLFADRSTAQAEAADEPLIDTLLIAGGDVRSIIRDMASIAWIQRMKGRVRRLGGVCTASFLLAEAGLLDGRRATTHWAAAQRLKERFPEVEVESDAIYVCDGIYTSAGVTAGMDLALSLLEEDAGRELALDVARYLVIYAKRGGGQSQFSSRLAAQVADPGPWGDLLAWIEQHPAGDLTVESLAARSHLSPRHFSRLFSRQMGVTPAKWVEKVRVDHARRLLEEEPGRNIDDIARACGFSESGVLRRLFLRHLKMTPREYRRRFGRSDGA